MDLRENWIKVEETTIFTYTYPCHKCRHKLTIIQTGKELMIPDLVHVAEKVHVKKQLDFLSENRGEKRISVQVKNNKNCTSS